MQMKFIKSSSESSITASVNRALAEGWEFVEMQTAAAHPSTHSYSDGHVEIVVVLQHQ